MKKAEGAKTAQELKEKYGRKRYFCQSLGIADVVNYLYMLFLRNEGITYEEQKRQKLNLFTRETYSKHANMRMNFTEEDKAVCDAYNHALNWVTDEFRYAVFVRDSTVRDEIAMAFLLHDKIKEICLRTFEEEKDENGVATISVYTDALDIFRASIEQNLKYLLMYNTFIELIAEAVKIPELTVLKVVVTDVNERVISINNFIADLKETVEKSGVYLDEQLFSKVIVGIQPAPPIQEAILKRIKQDLKNVTKGERYYINTCFENFNACYYEGKGIDAYAVG